MLERSRPMETQLTENRRREVALTGEALPAVEVAFNATDYVKPNTDIRYTLGLALDWIKA